MIEIYDDICTEKFNSDLYQYFINQSFKYGEADTNSTPPTGLVLELNFDSNVLKELLNLLKDRNIEHRQLTRSYVNLFLPHERPFFHVDGDVNTFLFYFTPQYGIDEGGETQFIVEDRIVGVLPKPCRLVVFDGNILHRATSFRTKPRITVALKFLK